MEMRDLMNLITESAHEGWTVIKPAVQDVTGDDAPMIMDEFNAHDQVSKEPADPGSEFSGNIYTYMNPERTIKVVLYPGYDGANGQYYSVTVYQRD